MSADELDLGATIRGFSIGQRVLGRYTLKKMLGRGGMGVVWLAHDTALDEELALKFLPEVVQHDEVALDELKRETRRARKLTHPHIVRIHDFAGDDSTAAISMEFVDGETLARRRLNAPAKILSPAELAPLVTQLCAALDYAHKDAGIVHRDLKPANLMIDSRGRLKVTDFGIARSITDSMSRVSRASTGDGSLPYMSPQQLSGEKPSVTDDVYAVGATLYELLTGRPPFFSGGMAAVMHQIQTKVPPSVAERRREFELAGEPIPVEWEQTIAACLAKDPAQRPASVREVAIRMALLPDQRVPRPTPSVEPARKPVAPTIDSSAPTIAAVVPPPRANLEAPPAADKSPHRARALVAILLGALFGGVALGEFAWVERALAGRATPSAHDYGPQLAWVIGAVLGGVGLGRLGDRIGRVRALALSLLVYAVFTGVMMLVKEPWLVATSRFIALAGVCGEWSLGVALVMELWPERRPLMAGLMSGAAALGTALVVMIHNYGHYMWYRRSAGRWYAEAVLVMAIPIVLALILRRMVPESGAWEESAKTRAEPNAPVKEVLTPPLLMATLRAVTLSTIPLIGAWVSVQWLPALIGDWTGRFGADPSDLASEDARVFSAVGLVAGCFFGSGLVALLSRRVAYFILCLGSLLACAWLFRGINTVRTPVVALTFVVSALSAGFSVWLPLYLAELFPTRVRATGLGLASNVAGVFPVLAVWVTQSVMGARAGLEELGLYLTLIYAAGLLVIWVCPETRGKPLPP